MKSKLLFFCMFFLLISSVYAVTIYVNPSPKILNKTINYTLNYSMDSSCTNIILSSRGNITTNTDGIGFRKINLTNITIEPRYLCEYKNGVLRKVHTNIFPDIFSTQHNFNLTNHNLTGADWLNGKLNWSWIRNAPAIPSSKSITDINSSVLALSKNNATANSKILALYSSNTSIWVKINGLLTSNTSVYQNINGLLSSNTSIWVKINGLLTSNTTNSNSIRSLSIANASLKASNLSTNAKITAVNTTVKGLLSSNTSTNNKINAVNTTVKGLLTSNISTNAKITAVNNSVKGLLSSNTSTNAKITAVNSTVKGLLTSNTTNSNSIRSLSIANASLRTSNQSTNARVTTLNKTKFDNIKSGYSQCYLYKNGTLIGFNETCLNATIIKLIPHGLDLYFLNSSSDISNSKHLSVFPNSTNNQVKLVYTGSSTRQYQNWTSKSNEVQINQIPVGEMEFHYHADANTGANIKTANPVFDVFIKNSTVNYIKVCTSEVTSSLTSLTDSEYSIHCPVTKQYPYHPTLDRMQVRLNFTVGAQPTSPTINFYIDYHTLSGIKIPESASSSSLFVPYTGALNNVNLGNHNLSANKIYENGKLVLTTSDNLSAGISVINKSLTGLLTSNLSTNAKITAVNNSVKGLLSSNTSIWVKINGLLTSNTSVYQKINGLLSSNTSIWVKINGLLTSNTTNSNSIRSLSIANASLKASNLSTNAKITAVNNSLSKYAQVNATNSINMTNHNLFGINTLKSINIFTNFINSIGSFINLLTNINLGGHKLYNGTYNGTFYQNGKAVLTTSDNTSQGITAVNNSLSKYAKVNATKNINMNNYNITNITTVRAKYIYENGKFVLTTSDNATALALRLNASIKALSKNNATLNSNNVTLTNAINALAGFTKYNYTKSTICTKNNITQINTTVQVRENNGIALATNSSQTLSGAYAGNGAIFVFNGNRVITGIIMSKDFSAGGLAGGNRTQIFNASKTPPVFMKTCKMGGGNPVNYSTCNFNFSSKTKYMLLSGRGDGLKYSSDRTTGTLTFPFYKGTRYNITNGSYYDSGAFHSDYNYMRDFQGFNFSAITTTNTTIQAPQIVNSFSLTSGKNIQIECNWLVNSTGTSSSEKANLSVSGTSSRIFSAEYFTSLTNKATFYSTSNENVLISPVSSAGTSVTPMRFLINTVQSGSGTFTSKITSNTTKSACVLAGSWCRSIEK